MDCRINIQRETSNLDPNTIIEAWSDASAPLNKFYQASTFGTKIGNRLSKKDVVMSRSWSAGGMPFSVLYMKHGPRGNHASKKILNEKENNNILLCRHICTDTYGIYIYIYMLRYYSTTRTRKN